MTLVSIAQERGIALEDLKNFHRAMVQTWQGIGSDYLAGFDGGEQEALDACGGDEGIYVAEATIDTDHIAMYGEWTDWPNFRKVCEDRNINILALGADVWNARSRS